MEADRRVNTDLYNLHKKKPKFFLQTFLFICSSAYFLMFKDKIHRVITHVI